MFALAVVIGSTPDRLADFQTLFFLHFEFATEMQQLSFRFKASCSFSNFSAKHFDRGCYDSLAGHQTFLAQRLISLIKCARRSLTTRSLCGVRKFVWHVGNDSYWRPFYGPTSVVEFIF